MVPLKVKVSKTHCFFIALFQSGVLITTQCSGFFKITKCIKSKVLLLYPLDVV